jgi:hypothetical protein
LFETAADTAPDTASQATEQLPEAPPEQEKRPLPPAKPSVDDSNVEFF